VKFKTIHKIIFDLGLLAVLLCLYNTNITGTALHEWGGLILTVLFIVHVAYNHKWVSGVSKKLLKKGTSGKIRLMFCLNTLLALCFLLVLISGILISREIFHWQQKAADIWLTIHIASAITGLVLIAIHFFLHWKIAYKTKKIIAVIMAALLLLVGAYNIIHAAPKMFPKTAHTEQNDRGDEDKGEYDNGGHTPKDGEKK
jgi:hypothetical protein